MLLLSEHLGAGVFAGDGTRLGALADIVVDLSQVHPLVVALVVRQRRRGWLELGWATVASFEAERVQLRGVPAAVQGGLGPAEGTDRRPEPEPGQLALAHDVLDGQIFDATGRRVVRAADVALERDNGELRLVAIEVGLGGVLRRLGLSRLARHARGDLIDWAELHVTSGRGHGLQLRSEAAAVHRMSPAQLASLVAEVPVATAAETLLALGDQAAADTVAASRPDVGARLVANLPARRAGKVVERMAADDAAATLRGLQEKQRADVLGALSSARAAELRRLLAHPAETAGGLMSPDVCWAEEGESLDAVRHRLAARPPRLESLATVFVVDDQHRPTGLYGPVALVLGRPPVGVVAVRTDTPVEEVIDRFAVEDVLALPVVDGAGRLVGAIAIDDVLDEMAVERLPGRRRFGSWPHGRHRRRR